MSVIPQVKCRRCGESFSALRSRCPNCGTRRVSQSGRTPAPTPSTVKGTAAYERAETNTRWQMIFGLILVVAVILAVIVMVSTSLSGLDNQSGKGSNNNIVATPTPTVNLAPTVEPPPTPTPTPTPTVEGINIQCFGTDVKEEFTLSLSRDAAGIELQATVLPMEVFTTVQGRDSSDLCDTRRFDGYLQRLFRCTGCPSGQLRNDLQSREPVPDSLFSSVRMREM